MATASAIASELRAVAKLLEKTPDAELKPAMLSWYTYSREEFMAVVPFIPRPATKRVDRGSSYPYFHLEHDTENLRVRVSAPQSATCTLVKAAQPAVYDCVPLLSEDEKESFSL